MRFKRNPISHIRSKTARFVLVILPLAVAFVIAATATVKPIFAQRPFLPNLFPFKNGSGIHNKRFGIHFTAQEMADLAAFLSTL